MPKKVILPYPETRVGREEMVVAQLADPTKEGVPAREVIRGQAMVASILERMDRLLQARVNRSFYAYCHSHDQSMSSEDLLATVKENLILAIYRYHADGKYEPYNYLMGVTNVVLMNVFLHRRRKKRIPPESLVRLDAPADFDPSFDRKRAEEWLAGKDVVDVDTDRFSQWMAKFEILQRKRYTAPGVSISCYELIRLILQGYSVVEVAKRFKVSRPTVYKAIRQVIIPALKREEVLVGHK